MEDALWKFVKGIPLYQTDLQKKKNDVYTWQTTHPIHGKCWRYNVRFLRWRHRLQICHVRCFVKSRQPPAVPAQAQLMDWGTSLLSGSAKREKFVRCVPYVYLHAETWCNVRQTCTNWNINTSKQLICRTKPWFGQRTSVPTCFENYRPCRHTSQKHKRIRSNPPEDKTNPQKSAKIAKLWQSAAPQSAPVRPRKRAACERVYYLKIL